MADVTASSSVDISTFGPSCLSKLSDRSAAEAADEDEAEVEVAICTDNSTGTESFLLGGADISNLFIFADSLSSPFPDVFRW